MRFFSLARWTTSAHHPTSTDPPHKTPPLYCLDVLHILWSASNREQTNTC